MGSTARHSTGRKAGIFRTRRDNPARPKSLQQSDFRRLLGRLSDAASIIATATSALEAAQDAAVTEEVASTGEKVLCLVRGLEEFRRAYAELDVALRTVVP